MERWHTSSYSNAERGNCVEVAESPQTVKMRDTKHREHGHLEFPTTEWHAFITDLERL